MDCLFYLDGNDVVGVSESNLWTLALKPPSLSEDCHHVAAGGTR